MTTCIRCKLQSCCNSSCSCTPSQIIQFRKDNGLELETRDVVYQYRTDNPNLSIKEIQDLNLDEYIGLSKKEKIAKFLQETGKDFISVEEIKILGN